MYFIYYFVILPIHMVQFSLFVQVLHFSTMILSLLLKAFVQKLGISLFGLVFIFCRIELIFGRLTHFYMKMIVCNCFCWFANRFGEIMYAKNSAFQATFLGANPLRWNDFEAFTNLNGYLIMGCSYWTLLRTIPYTRLNFKRDILYICYGQFAYNHAKIQINMLNFLYRVWSLPYDDAKFQINDAQLTNIRSLVIVILIMPNDTLYTEHSKLSWQSGMMHRALYMLVL